MRGALADRPVVAGIRLLGAVGGERSGRVIGGGFVRSTGRGLGRSLMDTLTPQGKSLSIPKWGGWGAKRPGHRWRVRSVNRAWSREELDGHADATRKVVCDLQVGGVGGLSAGAGHQGRTGRGRVLAGGLREGSEGQPVQDLEPDGLRELPAAAGAGGGDTQAAWRR